VIILFDERTQSQAEYTCMGLEQFPGAIKIGSTTSAADGNVGKILLPGQIVTYATFLGTFYPDYTPTQRVGIIPDFEVLPTIKGIRAGKDEVMDFALNCDITSIKEELVANIKLFPNPATYEINFDLGEEIATSIEIIDMRGRILKVVDHESSSGSIDISDINNGIYLFKYVTNNKTKTKMIVKQ